MRTTKHFIVMLLCALLYVPTALAQQIQDKQHDAQTNNTISAAATSGTTGRIAKFTSATNLGNSVVTELNANIGIGTANPQGRLDVSGNIVLNGNAKTQLSASGDVTFLNGGAVVAKGRFIELDM